MIYGSICTCEVLVCVTMLRFFTESDDNFEIVNIVISVAKPTRRKSLDKHAANPSAVKKKYKVTIQIEAPRVTIKTPRAKEATPPTSSRNKSKVRMANSHSSCINNTMAQTRFTGNTHIIHFDQFTVTSHP